MYAKPVVDAAERQLVLQQIQPALAALEATGVGERRAEGFGVVSVCDPFHYYRNPTSSHPEDDLKL